VFKKILVGTDGSETAKEAVRRAAQLARLMGSELIVLYGAKTSPTAPDVGYGVPLPDVESIRSVGHEILRSAVATTEATGDLKVRTMLREGDPAEVILDSAEEERADLIVVGNRGMRGGRRLLLGSVPNRVAHHAPCDVLIVHTT
jgi:nucleotide-binding universal stress UspA family protein